MNEAPHARHFRVLSFSPDVFFEQGICEDVDSCEVGISPAVDVEGCGDEGCVVVEEWLI